MSGTNPSWLKEPLLGLLGGQLSCGTSDSEIVFESASVPVVYIFSDKHRDPSPSELEFIANILSRQSEYIEKTTSSLVREIRRIPRNFGIVSDAVESVISGTFLKVPQFKFVFPLDGHWYILFPDTQLVIPGECGVLACFEGEALSRIENYSTPVAWFDTLSNEWIEY